MINGNYSAEDEQEIGEIIAKILMLKRSKAHKDRYQTEWGDKTATGIFNTIVRLGSDIRNGEGIVIQKGT